jgi:ATP-dependent DNA helicase DinG
VPATLPKPADPTHSEQVAALVARLSPIIGGRTLVLTTSLRALRTISEALQLHLRTDSGIEILAQGLLPKQQLMARFRQGAMDGQAGCILVASASFWEGVDIPGDALQMVVIDKLPFPTPNDPLVEARVRRLELAGRSPFNDYFVPEAAVALKQGAGRLIRRETDQGVLMICDTRLLTMGYGRRLLAALPVMRKLETEAEVVQTLQAFTKTSTTDSTWA